MKQKINDYEIVCSDDHNYIVYKVGTTKTGNNIGARTEEIIGYFNKIEAAVCRVAELCANEKEALDAWLAEYKRIVKEAFRVREI